VYHGIRSRRRPKAAPVKKPAATFPASDILDEHRISIPGCSIEKNQALTVRQRTDGRITRKPDFVQLAGRVLHRS
jgi:hypothetical protein